jgi:uncharacterized protein YdeI (YjbR/CyaY-like superfamily)
MTAKKASASGAPASRIEVCAYCSGVDVDELKRRANGKVTVHCIAKCAKQNPDLVGKAFGFLNGEFTACDTQDEFFARIEGLGDYVPSGDLNPLVDAYLEHLDVWRDEHEAAREICLASRLKEELKWGQPCYGFDGHNVLILGGFKHYFALTFFKGALLKDVAGLLVRQTENVQAGRQLRFRSVEEIAAQAATIRRYIEEAIRIEEAGLEVPEEKRPDQPIPDELQARFDADPEFKSAFRALTPGRQRGYLYYFNGAKQSETRAARIEKSASRIFEGLGFDEEGKR